MHKQLLFRARFREQLLRRLVPTMWTLRKVLPVLTEWTQIDLLRPARLWLLVYIPIRVSNGVRRKRTVFAQALYIFAEGVVCFVR